MAEAYFSAGENELTPTVRPTPGFDAEADCKKLRNAMKGLGSDKKAIASVLGNRTSTERMKSVLQFKTMYGKDLVRELDSELGGDFGKAVDALCHPPEVFDAMQLRNAMKGAGTDEDTLIEILCTRTNAQIHLLKNSYKTLYPGRNLEEDMEGETSGHFKRILISLAQGNRNESQEFDAVDARKDAQNLYDAGEKSLGTDESEFNMILASRSNAQLRAVFAEYKNLSRDIEEALKSEMSGNLQDAYLAIVQCACNRSRYFAEELHKSMKGLGTNDEKLIRIITSRSEIDLGSIKQEFQKLYGKTLASWVSSETSGAYKELMLALIGN